MKRVHYLLLGTVCCLALAALYGIYRGFLYCIMPTRCTVQSDAIAAPYLQEHFEHDCVSMLNQKSPQILLHVITQSMESCKEVCCKRYPSGAYIRLRSAQPRARINGMHILTEQGTLVPASEYREQALAGLPVVKVLEDSVLDEHITRDLLLFIQRMPLEFFEHYAVTWHNKTYIVATSVTVPLNTVIMTSETPWTHALMHTLQQLVHLPSRNNNKVHKKGTAWAVDIRFPGYMIRTPMQGGNS